MDTISKLQNRALRIIINFKNYRDHSDPLFSNNKILKIKDLITLQNILLVHDYLTDALPECFQNYFQKLNLVHPDITTKHSAMGCLFKPTYNTTNYGLHSITNNCIKDWNNMAEQLNKNLLEMSRSQLKSLLTKHLINQY